MPAYIGQMLLEEEDQLNECIHWTDALGGGRSTECLHTLDRCLEGGRSTKCLKIDMHNNTGNMTLYFYVKCPALFCIYFAKHSLHGCLKRLFINF